jgi:hypothetical protein
MKTNYFPNTPAFFSTSARISASPGTGDRNQSSRSHPSAAQILVNSEIPQYFNVPRRICHIVT